MQAWGGFFVGWLLGAMGLCWCGGCERGLHLLGWEGMTLENDVGSVAAWSFSQVFVVWRCGKCLFKRVLLWLVKVG